MSSMQIFKDVIVSEIPDSYAKASLGSERFDPINLDLARKQHRGYIEALRYCGCDVTVLPADERYPDCVFVEDPAVIVGSTALITRPGHASRFGEVERIRALLKAQGLIVVEITDPEAKIDGGDVQYTGKEILVGISQRTNRAGVAAVAEAFPGYRTIGVEVSGPLHLKTLIGLCGEDTLCVATESGDSIKMYERIRDLSSIPYKAIFVPEDNVANTILINGKVICKSRKENPRSFEALRRQCSHELVEIESSEIEKAVGSLTCLSLRYNKPKRVGMRPAPPPQQQQVDTVSPVMDDVAAMKLKLKKQKETNGRPIVTVGSSNSISGSSEDEMR